MYAINHGEALNLNCRFCGKIIKHEAKPISECPYCHAAVSKDINIVYIIKELVKLRGRGVLSDGKTLVSLLTDTAPELVRERSMIKRVYDDGLYRVIITDEQLTDGEFDRRFLVFSKRLQDESFMSAEVAGMIAGWFGEILGRTSEKQKEIKQDESERVFDKAMNALNCHRDDEAFKYMYQAAEMDNPKAQRWLGFMYNTGRGTERNTCMALTFWQKAALNKKYSQCGDCVAQFNIGVAFDTAVFGAKNPAMAEKWYKMSAEQGYVKAMYYLGCLMAETQRTAEAVYWWRAASDTGYPEALRKLGTCFFNGIGVVKNVNMAIQLWERAALGNKYNKKGDAISQYNLGLIYYRGTGVPIDYNAANKWLSMAASNGERGAEKFLTEIRQRIGK